MGGEFGEVRTDERSVVSLEKGFRGLVFAGAGKRVGTMFEQADDQDEVIHGAGVVQGGVASVIGEQTINRESLGNHGK